MRVLSLKASMLFAVAALLIPMASATSFTFDLTSNNLGISGSVGTVTIADVGKNTVSVSITMNAGYSIKLQGGDIAFTGPSDISENSYSNLQGSFGTTTYADLSFKGFKAPQNISQFGDFTFDFTNVAGKKHELSGVTSLTSLTFTLTAKGLTASEFKGIAIHFCDAGGTNCGKITGFASSSPRVATTPEPGTLGLIGTGLIGLATLVRRRKSS